MHIYVINGYPRAGKSTFVDYVRGAVGEEYVCEISTVDTIKQIAKTVGWDGTKDAKSRKFLSDLKDLFTDYNNFPIRETIEKVDSFRNYLRSYGVEDKGVIFIHCREPKDIGILVERLGAQTLFIERDFAKSAEFSNHADAEVDNYHYDLSVSNNGTLKDFKDSAYQFCRGQDIWH